jgi:hypothetical protein
MKRQGRCAPGRVASRSEVKKTKIPGMLRSIELVGSSRSSVWLLAKRAVAADN